MNFEIGKYYVVTGADGDSWIIQLKNIPSVDISIAGTMSDGFCKRSSGNEKPWCTMQTVREATKEEEEWLNSKK